MAIESSIASPAEPAAAEGYAPPAGPTLLLRLGEALDRECVSYDWSGPGSQDGPGTGTRDVDLKVPRAHLPRVAAILSRLGFKPVYPSAGAPGDLETIGHDAASGGLIRVRVQHRPAQRPEAGAPRHRLASGGAVIAIVGGDGAGKSTVVEGLCAWLSTHFQTASVHMGKPGWSWVTATLRAVVKLGQLLGLYPPETTFRETLHQRSRVSPGYPWLLRELCRARDRYWLLVGARRFAGAGGLVVSDRFPLPQIRLMDGPLGRRLLEELADRPQDGALLIPRASHWLARLLIRLEESYYRHLAPPDVLIVLRVDPEIAVTRVIRRSNEDPVPVRERSTEIWRLDWRTTSAHVVDAGKPRDEVLAEVKALVWAEL